MTASFSRGGTTVSLKYMQSPSVFAGLARYGLGSAAYAVNVRMAAVTSAGILPRRRHSAARSGCCRGSAAGRSAMDPAFPRVAGAGVGVFGHGRLPSREARGGLLANLVVKVVQDVCPIQADRFHFDPCGHRFVQEPGDLRSPRLLSLPERTRGIEVRSLRVAIRMSRAAMISDSTSTRRLSTPRRENTRMPAAAEFPGEPLGDDDLVVRSFDEERQSCHQEEFTTSETQLVADSSQFVTEGAGHAP